jgi:chaperone modulatory protein CbpM
MTSNFTLATPVESVIGTWFVEPINLTFEDLCQACGEQAAVMEELIEEGVLDSVAIQLGRNPAHWRFSGLDLSRVKIALRLHHDLEVNFAGAALALHLMDEIERIRSFAPTVSYRSLHD